MFKFIDQSQFLIRMLQKLSAVLSRQRGLLIVIGLVLVIAGFVVELVNLSLGNPALNVAQIVFRNLGIIVALVGLLLVEPLGG
jgi:hypothetical protein